MNNLTDSLPDNNPSPSVAIDGSVELKMLKNTNS